MIVRHGQSTWNQQNIFIGMTDTPLTEEGMKEARVAGHLLAEEGVAFDLVYTSLLRRSTKTVWIMMQELGMEWVAVLKDWRLNERNYGALVGRNKKQCVEEFGKEQVKLWRRSWDTPPPPMPADSPYHPSKESRYKTLNIDISKIPASESLKDVTARTSDFWDKEIVPLLQQGKRLMIVGHENNLRSILKRLDGVSETDIINIELPRAIPIIYSLDRQTLKPIKLEGSADYLSGRYLGNKEVLKKIYDRDQQQVYDLHQKHTLEEKGLLYHGFAPKAIEDINRKLGVSDRDSIRSVPPIKVSNK